MERWTAPEIHELNVHETAGGGGPKPWECECGCPCRGGVS